MNSMDTVMDNYSVEHTVKPRRKRTVIPVDELRKLERLFLENNWPSRIQKQLLADELGRTEQFVSIWFQNKRARVKKQQENGELVLAPRANVTSQRRTPPAQYADKLDTSNIRGLNNVIKCHLAGQSGSDSKLVFHPRSSNKVSTGESRGGIGDGPAVKFVNQHCYNDSEARTGYCRYDTLPYPVYDQYQREREDDLRPEGPAERRSPPSLLESIVTMMMLDEGMIPVDQYGECNAVNHALYGIRLDGGHRLVYDRLGGLDVVKPVDSTPHDEL